MVTVEDLFLRGGGFEIGGVRLEGLLAGQSTPLYAYSAEMIESAYREVRGLFPGFDIIYSFKANPGLAIAARLQSLGAGADVSSLGELKTALKAGFDPDDIFFVGPAKTERELALAVESGIYAVIVESARELALVDELAAVRSRRQRVLLRINTSEMPTAPEVMVGGPSKFGFDEESVVDEVRALDLAGANVAGIHVYSASQVLDAGFICNHLEHVVRAAFKVADGLGVDLECIDFGGGFGVPYGAGEPELDLEAVSGKARQLMDEMPARPGGRRLVFELGRYLTARAGVFLTRVLGVKESRGRRFVLTDGGMNVFSRPVVMRIPHEVRVLNKLGEPATLEYDVCGPICTPIDCTARGVKLPQVESGDIIGFFNAGAYGYTMSLMNFMSLGWPAEVLVEGGRVNLIRKPRSAESFFEDQIVP